MRAQANCVHFFGALVFDVGSEQLFGEHIAFEQERMIFLQSIQCIFERAWHRGNFGQLLRAQVVDILVERLTGIDFVFDAIQSSHHHRCECHVRIAARIGRAELDALGFGRRRIHRDAAGCRTIAPRVGKIHRSFKARN